MFVANELFATNKIDGIEVGNKLIEKCGKLLKTRKLSKGLKLSKSENSKGKKLAKFKKPSKSKNSPIFNAKKAGPNFLMLEARTAFNRLWLAFTKALIL